PEAASVGLSLAEAEQAGHRVRAVDVDLGSIAGAGLYGDGYTGRARMVVDLEDEVLRGLTLVGPGVGEMIHAVTIGVAARPLVGPGVGDMSSAATGAVAARVAGGRAWHAVPSYRTVSEVWLRLLEAYRDA